MRRRIRLKLDHAGLTKEQAAWLRRAERQRAADKTRLRQARAIIRGN